MRLERNFSTSISPTAEHKVQMYKKNKLLITFDEQERTTLEQVLKIKPMGLFEIKKACEEYNPDIDYLHVLTNLLSLKIKIKNKGAQKNESF